MAPASQEPEPASATTTRPDSDSSVDNIAQAYRDLQRGEQAASALEANLTNLENRLDDTQDRNSPSGQKRNEGSGPDASGAAKKP
ncbi:hypothetical protein K456DRAFT_130027 [Colletotrichum gloeosporioides 23]|nr:hypothetical protein K456DRAFT_130027 [Colletotrichum gloeosporioides 23]